VFITLDYCSSVASGTTNFIRSFSTTGGITNINNATNAISANGYGNFTAQSLSANPSSTINFSAGLSTTSTYGLSIFVDWNRNFNFELSERVYFTRLFRGAS
jgi:hypothetical protein